MARPKRGNDLRDKISVMIAPHFDLLLKELDKRSIKYGIVLPTEFFVAVVFTIYALYMHFYGYSDSELLFFASFAALSFLMANSSRIFNILKKMRDSPETTSFLKDIENKEINEVQKFLRNFYRELSSEDIILLLNSKFSLYPSIHMSILKYQKISGKTLEYLIANCIDKNIDADILSKYIYRTRDDISNETVNQILFKYKDKKEIVKSLFVNFPMHFRKIRIFSYLSKLLISIRDWFNYGLGDGWVALPSFLFGIIITFVYYGPIIIKATSNLDLVAVIINLLNIFMGLFIFTSLIFIAIKVTILTVLRICKWILYLIAPSQNPEIIPSA